MILVDSSVWVDHLRAGDARLIQALEAGEVLMHPFVIAELALGSLRNREDLLGLLGSLPRAATATDVEILAFIEAYKLFGLGIGFVDTHLLAATRIEAGARLWTRDRRLLVAARRMGIEVDWS